MNKVMKCVRGAYTAINGRAGRFAALFLAVVSIGTMARATETIPTDITTATAGLVSSQADTESYASWGLFIMGAIGAAVVVISWYRAAKAKR